MNPTFTIIHASHGRPVKAIEAMRLALQRAMFPLTVQYIIALNRDDPARAQYSDLWQDVLFDPKFYCHSAEMVVGDYIGSAHAWNEGARMATGDVLIQGQDDVEPPVGWDVLLAEKIRHRSVNDPIFIAVSDGYRKDALCCTAIMTRAYRDLEGCFLCPDYLSVFSDDEVTYRALRRARDGTAHFIEARDIVFLHRHHYHDKTVPLDATYQRENSAHSYAHGMRLFRERNPKSLTDGLKTW